MYAITDGSWRQEDNGVVRIDGRTILNDRRGPPIDLYALLEVLQHKIYNLEEEIASLKYYAEAS